VLNIKFIVILKFIPGRCDKNGFEEIFLDENQLSLDLANSEGSAYFALGFLRHTLDCKIIAYGIDSNGNERYNVRFMNMDTKEMLPDLIPDAYENFEFSNCGIYCFYIVIDEFERAYALKRHKIGSPAESDVVLYEEKDEMFCLTMTKTSNKQ
jgi:oligopeptidase B